MRELRKAAAEGFKAPFRELATRPARWVIAGAFGVVLGECDLRWDMWQCWALTLLFIAYGSVSRGIGHD